MSHEQKEPLREAKGPARLDMHGGIFKEKEKADLENRIVDTLKSLNGRMTKKEILSLVQRIEVGKGLEGLRTELEKEKKLESAEISDEVLHAILDLFREVEQIAELGLKELKLELSGLNESREYTIDQAVYLSHRFPWIKKLEKGKLGENIVIDIAGLAVGSLDSIHAIIKFLLTLITDIIFFPKQVIDEMRKK